MHKRTECAQPCTEPVMAHTWGGEKKLKKEATGSILVSVLAGALPPLPGLAFFFIICMATACTSAALQMPSGQGAALPASTCLAACRPCHAQPCCDI